LLQSKIWKCEVYSGLIVTWRTGRILHSPEFEFEQNLCDAFLQHTEGFTADQNIHRIRALTLKAETMYLRGKWTEAINATNYMEKLYEMEVHAPIFFSLYDLDHSLFSIARRPYARMLLGDKETAIQECQYLIRNVLPRTDPMKLLNRTQMLLPLFAILKNEPDSLDAIRTAFQYYVVDPQRKYQIETPAQGIIDPLIRLLEVLADPEYIPKETIDWVLDPNTGHAPVFLNTICAHFCWAWSTITMELCLRVAKCLYRKGFRNQSILHKLVEKGYAQSAMTHSVVKGVSDDVLLIPAWHTHEPLLKELIDFASVVGYVPTTTTKNDNDGTVGLSSTTESKFRKTEMTSLGKIWLAR